MYLSFRPAEMQDFEPCYDLLTKSPGGAFPSSTLLDLWKKLNTARAMQMAVVEDREPPSRIVGFRCDVFVSDRTMQAALHSTAPYITSQFLQGYFSGEMEILEMRSIREANSGEGLNLYVLHAVCEQHSLSPHGARCVRDKLMEAFLSNFRGYRLKEHLREVYGEAELNQLIACGLRLRTDYPSFFGRNAPKPPGGEAAPYLVGITREEVVEGSYISPVFIHTPPRFFFSDREQDLLRHALLGESDEELSRSMGVSCSAIKKRWSRVYECVSALAPWLLPAASTEEPGEQRRGVEKRRHLLNYLRHHPEELRPILSTGPLAAAQDQGSLYEPKRVNHFNSSNERLIPELPF